MNYKFQDIYTGVCPEKFIFRNIMPIKIQALETNACSNRTHLQPFKSCYIFFSALLT